MEPIKLWGFNPTPSLGSYNWGPAAVRSNGEVWKEHRYSMETLATFDHDYLGWHLYAQVWDYGMQEHPDQRWQYFLFLHGADRVYRDGFIVDTQWDWCIHREYFEGLPTYSAVGDDVDRWLRAPEPIRFLLMDR